MIILLAAEFFLRCVLLGSFFHIAMNGMAASDKIFALAGPAGAGAGNARHGRKRHREIGYRQLISRSTFFL